LKSSFNSDLDTSNHDIASQPIVNNSNSINENDSVSSERLSACKPHHTKISCVLLIITSW
jgi:hypothetical protein